MGLLGACGTEDDGGGQSAEDGIVPPPSDGGPSSSVGETTAGTSAGTGAATGVITTEATAADGTTGPSVLFDVGGSTGETGGPMTYPVRMLPGLESITFYERTGGTEPDACTSLVDGAELTVRLADPLADGNFDIDGATGRKQRAAPGDAEIPL